MTDLLTSPFVEQLRAQRLAREGLFAARAARASFFPTRHPSDSLDDEDWRESEQHPCTES